MSERDVSKGPWNLLSGPKNGQTGKKTDFSIDSLLRIPYLCRQSNYHHVTQRPESRHFTQTDFELNFTDVNVTSDPPLLPPPPRYNKKGEGERVTNEGESDHGHGDIGKEFSWLYCSRFKPPKLPRSKKRGGCKRYGRGPRIPFAPYQIRVLENAFQKSQYLSPDGISRLAESLFLTETRVKIWLQNRRARYRREMGKSDHHPSST